MEKESKLVKKVRRLVRRAGLPQWLHRFGPKKYELWNHVLALLVRELFRMSYRRVVSTLKLLGFLCASKSAIQATAKKLPVSLWQQLLAATLTTGFVSVAAIDGTGFSRTSPSLYYIRRIGGVFAKRFVKVSILADTRRKKVLSAVVRLLPAHDVRDVPKLLRQTPCQHKTLVADKGYDSEKIHELCYEKNIQTMIPSRKRCKKGFYRHKMLKKFRTQTYRRREIIESIFSSIKRKFGSTVQCCRARTVRAQIFCRLILHNTKINKNQDSGQSLSSR